MQIERIPFPPIGSNMYVVTQGRDAIVLDPWPDEATMQRLQGYHALISEHTLFSFWRTRLSINFPFLLLLLNK